MHVDLTLLERHREVFRSLLARDDGSEAAAYVLCGLSDIRADPWSRQHRLRLTSFEVLPIPQADEVSSSSQHVTWSTGSFVSLCRRAAEEGMVPGIIHSHPRGFPTFSPQDDRNERDLFQLVRNRNGDDAKLASLLLVGDDSYRARLWVDEHGAIDCRAVRTVGSRLFFEQAAADPEPIDDVFDRQARAFGSVLNTVLRELRVGVVGCGGTGSATAMFLARLGVGHIALFDEDIVEVSNLNRLHGARRARRQDDARPVYRRAARATDR